MHPPLGPRPSPQQIPLYGHPQHDVQFYSDDDVLIDGIEKFLRGAVENGDGAICIATRKHLVALAARLKVLDQGMAAAAEQGRCLWIDVADFLSAVMSEGKVDDARTGEFFGNALSKTSDAIGRESPCIAVFGETVAVLWGEGKIDDVLRLERLGNKLVRENPVTVRCAYPIRAFHHPQDTEYFRTICSEHSAVIAAEGDPVAVREESRSTSISSDELLAQERRSVERDTELSYPEWQGQYWAALLEMDVTRLFKQVEVSQAAILTRLHSLRGDPDHHTERHQLMQAWRVLQIIKREKLGFDE